MRAAGRARFLGESGWLVARANLWGWTPVVLAGYLWPMPGPTNRAARAGDRKPSARAVHPPAIGPDKQKACRVESAAGRNERTI